MAINYPTDETQTFHTATSETSSITLTSGVFPIIVGNLGATGEVNFTLPLPRGGEVLIARVQAAQVLKLTAAAASAIVLAGTKGSDAGNISADAAGEDIMLVGTPDGDWLACFATGTWTAA